MAGAVGGTRFNRVWTTSSANRLPYTKTLWVSPPTQFTFTLIFSLLPLNSLSCYLTSFFIIKITYPRSHNFNRGKKKLINNIKDVDFCKIAFLSPSLFSVSDLVLRYLLPVNEIKFKTNKLGDQIYNSLFFFLRKGRRC